MLGERTGQAAAIHFHGPDVCVLVVGPLRTECDESAVGRPVAWKLWAIAVQNSPYSAAGKSLAQQAHTPYITSAEDQLARVRRPHRQEFRSVRREVGKARNRAIPGKIHQPDG